MKREGFTLIELLAVIVILAIIALIATPIVLNIINDAREQAYDESVNFIEYSSELYYSVSMLNGSSEMDKNVYDEVIKLIEGEKPSKGSIYINGNGEVAYALQYGEWCYTKAYEDSTYTKEKTDECNIPFYYIKVASMNKEDQFLEGPITKESIEKVITVNSNEVPQDVIGSWDVTDQENVKEKYKVMAWYKDEDNDGLYEVYIGQNGGVKANPDSSGLFSYLTNATEVSLTYFDTSNVVNMKGLFANCISLKELDLSSFDTSEVTDMSYMFAGMFAETDVEAMSLEVINGLENFDTSNVTTMRTMFQLCANLTKLDLSNFNTNEVIDMAYMFNQCNNLKELDLSSFDTSKVTYMQAMFQNCKKLTMLNISNFKTSKVTDISYIFSNCHELSQINMNQATFNSVTEYTSMFSNDIALTTIIVKEENSKTWLEERISEASLSTVVLKSQ